MGFGIVGPLLPLSSPLGNLSACLFGSTLAYIIVGIL